MPIHVGTLVFMGIHLIDNADFDALATAAATTIATNFYSRWRR